MIKFFGQKNNSNKDEKKLTLMDIKEGFTSAEISEVLQSWNEVQEQNLKVTKLIIVNAKRFSGFEKGEIVDVEKVEENKYKRKDVGGVFTVPSEDDLEDILDSNILYAPYFA